MIFGLQQNQTDLSEWLSIKPETDVEADQLDRLHTLHTSGQMDAPVRPNPEDGSIAIALRIVRPPCMLERYANILASKMLRLHYDSFEDVPPEQLHRMAQEAYAEAEEDDDV